MIINYFIAFFLYGHFQGLGQLVGAGSAFVPAANAAQLFDNLLGWLANA